jgi:hypothetical protein
MVDFFSECLNDGAHLITLDASTSYSPVILGIPFHRILNEGCKKIPFFHPPVNFDKPHRAERMEHSVRMHCQTPQLEDLPELI